MTALDEYNYDLSEMPEEERVRAQRMIDGLKELDELSKIGKCSKLLKEYVEKNGYTKEDENAYQLHCQRIAENRFKKQVRNDENNRSNIS